MGTERLQPATRHWQASKPMRGSARIYIIMMLLLHIHNHVAIQVMYHPVALRGSNAKLQQCPCG
jgi:hypothetical protein